MMPLHEHGSLRQRPEEGFRRWFLNDFFDVIIWYHREGGPLKGFQLCYNKARKECAFTWEPESSGSHFISSVKSGSRDHSYATGVLHGDAGKIPGKVVHRLKEEQGDLPEDLLSLILERVQDFNHRYSSV